MAKVYLETSFFSACVGDRTDAKSVALQTDSRRWWVQQRRLHVLCISAEVLRELPDRNYQHRDDALALTVDCVRLDLTDEVRGFAKILVHEKVMPGPSEAGDALHVAACIIHRCEYLLTWNVKHLANRNKTAHLRSICARVGFLASELITPEQLWELEA